MVPSSRLRADAVDLQWLERCQKLSATTKNQFCEQLLPYLQQIRDALSDLGDQEINAYIEPLLNKIKTSSEKKTKVVLFGPSGVGMPTILTQLIDLPYFSLPSGVLGACRGVVTNLCHSADNNLYADVSRINAEHRRLELAAIVPLYIDEHGVVKNISIEEHGNIKHSPAADLAEVKLRNYFPKLHRSKDSRKELWLFEDRIDELRPRLGGLVQIKRHKDEAAAFSNDIEKYIRPPLLSSDKATEWVFVTEVTLHVPAPLLENGLVLVDLLGSGSTSNIRPELADHALATATGVMAVVPMIGNHKSTFKTACRRLLKQDNSFTTVTVVVNKVDHVYDSKFGDDYPSIKAARTLLRRA